jgi:hypothetical protein
LSIPESLKTYSFYNKRGSEDGKFFEWYRCFDEDCRIRFHAHAELYSALIHLENIRYSRQA